MLKFQDLFWDVPLSPGLLLFYIGPESALIICFRPFLMAVLLLPQISVTTVPHALKRTTYTSYHITLPHMKNIPSKCNYILEWHAKPSKKLIFMASSPNKIKLLLTKNYLSGYQLNFPRNWKSTSLKIIRMAMASIPFLKICHCVIFTLLLITSIIIVALANTT